MTSKRLEKKLRLGLNGKNLKLICELQNNSSVPDLDVVVRKSSKDQMLQPLLKLPLQMSCVKSTLQVFHSSVHATSALAHLIPAELTNQFSFCSLTQHFHDELDRK